MKDQLLKKKDIPKEWRCLICGWDLRTHVCDKLEYAIYRNK